MAWTTVETPNAKYILMFSSHIQKLVASPVPFDALILEGVPKQWLISSRQYRNLVRQAIKNKKQIWVTDVPTETTKDKMRDVLVVFLKRFCILQASDFFWGLTRTNKK